MPSPRCSRRRALTAVASSLLLPQALQAQQAPAAVHRDTARPNIPMGVASGDVTDRSAVVWSRCDREAQMLVEWSTTEAFADSRRAMGPAALEINDFTAKLELAGLPPGQTIFYRVSFVDLADPRVRSEPVVGRLRTPSAQPRDVRFAWSGDTCGQGWGIDVDRGGMKLYDAIARREPDFFIHSGDCVYADGPLPAEIKLSDGTLWRNLVTPEKSKVAETLDEFRGQYRYNLLDENVRRFNALVPQYVQWDDHETTNNWYPGEMLNGDRRYEVKSCSLLSARGRRALLDYTPIRETTRGAGQIHRAYGYGPLVDVILLDERSFRGSNGGNRQEQPSAETAFLGAQQLAWVKRRLRTSPAVWKVIASDMPIGLVVGDERGTYENAANGDGPALGRELEIGDLLRFIKQHAIQNVVWLTADVHYAAAHYYDPQRATFSDFLPFWEFVAGPLHAGTFGPGTLDNTFGPQVKFTGIPPGMIPNRGPADGFQFFGEVQVSAATKVMSVSLYNLAGARIYQVELPAV